MLPSQQLFRPAARVSADLSQGNTVNLHGAIGQASLEGFRKRAVNVDVSDFDLQLENNRLSAGLMADGRFSPQFSMKPKLPGYPKEADKKTGLLQNPYQGPGSLYGGQMRHNGASSNSAKAIPSQLFSFLYHQMGDPRKSACHPIQSPVTVALLLFASHRYEWTSARWRWFHPSTLIYKKHWAKPNIRRWVILRVFCRPWLYLSLARHSEVPTASYTFTWRNVMSSGGCWKKREKQVSVMFENKHIHVWIFRYVLQYWCIFCRRIKLNIS